MINEGKIGEKEAIALLVTVMTTKLFLTTPTVLVSFGGSAAWMIALIAGLVTYLFFWLVITKYLQRFPDKTFMDSAEEVAGPYFGSLINVVLLLTTLVMWSMPVRSFSEMIIVTALPETPLSIIVITFVAAAIFGAYLGIQTLARACYLSFPFTLLAVIVITTLTFPHWCLDWLFPLFGKGIDQVLKYGALRSADYLEFRFLYLMPFLFFPKQFKGIGNKSIGIAILLFILVEVTYLLTFPAAVGEEPYLPLYMMARSVYLGRFIQRIEVIFVLFWVVSGLLWMSTGLYLISRIITSMLKLPDYRPLILPVAILMLSIAFIPANLPDTVLFYDYLSRNLILPVVDGLPILVLLLAILRGKGAKASAQ